MKRIALTAMAALIALAVAVSPATAETVQSVQKFEAKVSPTKAGTKKKPTPVSLFANPYFDDISPDLGREVQFATVNANVYFPKGGVYNGKFFPSCSATTVFQDEKQCPKGSQVGSAPGLRQGPRPRRGRRRQVLQPARRQGHDPARHRREPADHPRGRPRVADEAQRPGVLATSCRSRCRATCSRRPRASSPRSCASSPRSRSSS